MLQIKQPLKTFYKRCLFDYHIGDTSHYLTVINSAQKDCYNPHISTECDIQVKLGGIIDAYLVNEHLPFSVNAEMKVYDNPSQKADLSIHRIFKDTLYVNHHSPKDNLECVIEVKYANAKKPKFDFDNKKIDEDLIKLSSLNESVQKVFVLIDEADRTPQDKLNWLISECQNRKIWLFSNNNYINYKLNFPYGFNQVFCLSRKAGLKEKDYIFGKRDDFLRTVEDCFKNYYDNDETIEINLNDTKIFINYATAFDPSKDELIGNIIIETYCNKPLTEATVNRLFTNLVSKNKSYLYLVADEKEYLVLG